MGLQPLRARHVFKKRCEEAREWKVKVRALFHDAVETEDEMGLDHDEKVTAEN